MIGRSATTPAGALGTVRPGSPRRRTPRGARRSGRFAPSRYPLAGGWAPTARATMGGGGDGRVADQAGRAGAVVALAGERRVGQAVSLGATLRAGATLGAGSGWPVSPSSSACRDPWVLGGADEGCDYPGWRQRTSAPTGEDGGSSDRLPGVKWVGPAGQLSSEQVGRGAGAFKSHRSGFQLIDQQPVRCGYGLAGSPARVARL